MSRLSISDLKQDPAAAAKRLAEQDPWVLQRLHHAFDTTPRTAFDLLHSLELAIRSLGGRLGPSQRTKLAIARDLAA